MKTTKQSTRNIENFEVLPLTASSNSNENHHFWYIPLHFRQCESIWFLDISAVQGATSENEPQWNITAHISTLSQERPPPFFEIQISESKFILLKKQITWRFAIAGKEFEKTFIALPTTKNILKAMSFFQTYAVILNIGNYFIQFPSLSLRLKQTNGKFSMRELRGAQKMEVPPFQ